MISKKALERKIESRKGKILFRRDRRLSSKIAECPEFVHMSRRLIGLLFPWNMRMLNVIIKNGQLGFNEKLALIHGMEISKDQLYEVYMNSRAYQRLAEMDYD